jgi:hypothetical protein
MPRFAMVLLVFCATTSTLLADSPSYLQEVLPLLTKQGCNQGGCHGKGAGQNGFRLSLRGYAPELDHRWMTREFDTRRINPTDPESSLLIQKATGQLPHEGGRLFSVGSREYHTLLNWIKAGTPGPDSREHRITKLELEPAVQTLKVSQKVALKAWASFADGSRRDVTWLTKFDSNDMALAEVLPTGQLTAKRNGATAIRAQFLTEVAVSTISIPFERTLTASPEQTSANVLDKPVLDQLRAIRIPLSPLSDDESFIRRVFLDVCGSLPSPKEVTDFLADQRANKRAILIDNLLQRPEFVDYWTLFLNDLLQNRKERDHDVRGTKGVRQFHAWLRDQVAKNRPWDELAREVLTATGTNTENPAVGYYIVTVGEHRHGENSEAPEAIAQAFLGTRIGCAKCHNHPLERYTQDDYYHFAAFFSRVKLDRKEAKQAPTTLRISHPDEQQNRRATKVSQPRTGQPLSPQPLDRSKVTLYLGGDPRLSLARWITSPSNDFFSGAMVNRIWKHFLGTGLVEPVDDLRATNPPSNPELMRVLQTEFVQHGFDMKHLIRLILNSRTYQTASVTLPGNETDTRFYSHYYARRLPAEVLLDAITSASGIPEKFDGFPEGVRAVQIPDPHSYSAFLKLFGSSERVTACACERTGDVTLPQLLNLQNGERMLAKLRDEQGTLGKLLRNKSSDAEVIESLFLSTLSRLPRQSELDALQAALKNEPREEVLRDLFWALLNSKDFAFNH